jgi:hypothetical protein
MTQGFAVCLLYGLLRCTNIVIPAQYLNDTWVFDTQEYKWRQIEFKDTDRKPSCVVPRLLHLYPVIHLPLHSPRSGFSFLSTPEGIVLHGTYATRIILLHHVLQFM